MRRLYVQPEGRMIHRIKVALVPPVSALKVWRRFWSANLR